MTVNCSGKHNSGNNTVQAWRTHSRWPAFKGGDCEQGHHSRQDIVKVEITVLPDPLFDHGTIDISILINDVNPSVGNKTGISEMLN